LPAAAAEGLLTIDADGFKNAAGAAIARIYAPGDDVTGEPRWTVKADIVDGRAHMTQALPPGHYAVVVHHDRNGNGRVDHNMFGFPAEPLGFSGRFALSLTSGLPSFPKLRFELPASGVTLHISVH
jgi:uncharacterized protein (DUF2141 family)